jgi:hypothetical protein
MQLDDLSTVTRSAGTGVAKKRLIMVGSSHSGFLLSYKPWASLGLVGESPLLLCTL